jgi:hypothetical protein
MAVCACTLLAALLGAPIAQAAGPEPPTAAEVERHTAAFLTEHGARSAVPRGGGGVGTGEGEPAPGAAALFPHHLMVALYGAPQLKLTAVGKRSPRGAVRRLRKQANAYRPHSSRKVVRSINLIGVIATATAGSDGKYRTRQSDAVIRTYLRAVRSAGGRLTLDIQPGRSPVMRELRALRKWIRLPDVDVGIDPEWNVGLRGVPGRDDGSIGHRELNRASRWIDELVEGHGLPPKAMIVHQFREGSITGRKRVEQRAGAQVLLNFDGIGGRAAKRAGYERLAQPGLFDGFSLFYDRDVELMRPKGVLRLKPRVDYAMYQ